jgi:hypothetical protein
MKTKRKKKGGNFGVFAGQELLNKLNKYFATIPMGNCENIIEQELKKLQILKQQCYSACNKNTCDQHGNEVCQEINRMMREKNSYEVSNTCKSMNTDDGFCEKYLKQFNYVQALLNYIEKIDKNIHNKYDTYVNEFHNPPPNASVEQSNYTNPIFPNFYKMKITTDNNRITKSFMKFLSIDQYDNLILKLYSKDDVNYDTLNDRKELKLKNDVVLRYFEYKDQYCIFPCFFPQQQQQEENKQNPFAYLYFVKNLIQGEQYKQIFSIITPTISSEQPYTFYIAKKSDIEKLQNDMKGGGRKKKSITYFKKKRKTRRKKL